MSIIGVLLVVFLVLILIGGLPTWPHAATWNYGYYPSGIIGIVLVIVLVLLLMGHL
jgi:hypothetical protein